MKIRISYIASLFLIMISLSVHAQSLSTIPGSFVDIGFGARPAGMGFAHVGIVDDENATYWNPSGLAQSREYMAGFNQIDQLGLLTYNYASAVIPLPGRNHSIGFTAISSGDDALQELSFHAAYGIQFDMVNLGVAVKYRDASFGNNSMNRDDLVVFDPSEIEQGIAQQVFGDASGVGVDLGLLLTPTDKFSLGVMVRDIYSFMNWNSQARGSEYQARGEYNESLPYEVIFGTSLVVSKNLLAAVDFQPAVTDDRSNFVRAGLEGRLAKVLLLRVGTEQAVNDFDDEKYMLGSGVHVHAGDRFKIRADYAYVIEQLGNSQRISLAITF